MINNYFPEIIEIDMEYLRDCLRLTPYERFLYVEQRREELFEILPDNIKKQIIKNMYDISDKLDPSKSSK
jgi:hypothetical protein